MTDISIYKENQKTTFLAEEYERLQKEESGLRDMFEKDPKLKEMAEEEMPYHIDTIYCEYCRSTIDYGYIDNRVAMVCSELCSDMFLNTLQ